MNQLDRILQRQSQVNEAEVQTVRERAIARLSAMSDPHDDVGAASAPGWSMPPGDREPPWLVAPAESSIEADSIDPETATDGEAGADPGVDVDGDAAPSTDIVVIDHAEPIVLPLHGLWASSSGDGPASTEAAAPTEGVDLDPDARPLELMPPVLATVIELPVRAHPALEPHERHRPRPITKSAARRAAKPRAVAAAYCPYCALLLDPPPTADRRCSRCRQQIVVREVEDGRLVHLTEAAVLVFEAERERAANIARWTIERRTWLDLARAAGATANRIERFERPVASLEGVRAARAFYDTTVDHAVDEAIRRDLWDVAAQHRREQANALRLAEGRPFPPSDEARDLYRAAATIELRGIAAMARNAAVVGARCCDACRADDGTVHRIAGELRAARLPHAGCPTGLCRCHWDLSPHDVQLVQRYLERTTGSAGEMAGTTTAEG